MLAFEHNNGIEHVCIVAFSVYGTDNRSLIDALVRLKGKGRGVACIDPDLVTNEELQDMHVVGVRAIRLNLRTRSEKLDRASFAKLLRKNANKIRSLGWALQLYISLDQIALIAEVVPSLGVPIVIDHIGSPAADLPPRKQAGYAEFMNLLAHRQIWVKLSGLYRLSNTPELEVYIREILRVAPTQVVWASDWPHSGGVEKNPGGDRNKVQDYRKVSIPNFIAACKRWCDYDEDLMQKIWVDNPRRLWQYSD